MFTGISLGFGVAGKHCQEIGKIYCFIVQPNGPIFKVAGTEGKVGGCFCRLPALNENTGLPKLYSILGLHTCQTCKKSFKTEPYFKSHYLIHTCLPKLYSIMGLHTCQTCKKSFKTEHYLKSHYLINKIFILL